MKADGNQAALWRALGCFISLGPTLSLWGRHAHGAISVTLQQFVLLFLPYCSLKEHVGGCVSMVHSQYSSLWLLGDQGWQL